MRLFFGKKKSPLIKQAESALQMADKVIHYRCDVLGATVVDQLLAARNELAALLSEATGRNYKARGGSSAGQGGSSTTAASATKAWQLADTLEQPASAKTAVNAKHTAAQPSADSNRAKKAAAADATQAKLEHTLESLGNLLSRHGGRIYPNTFGAENIEMLVVAAILAIGIRSFFFQPFKIPTNSMWPTYAGMVPVVYPLSEERPGLLKRGINRVLYWSNNHYITAPVSGEVIIPVVSMQTDHGPESQLLRESSEGTQLFGLRKVPQSRYVMLVGQTQIEVDVPQDFPLEPVVLQTYFPGYKSLQEALTAYRAQGKVEVSMRAGTKMPIYLIRTDTHVHYDQPVLDFDIKTGDMLFVDRFSYNFIQPKIGDPIVFRTENIPGLRTALGEQGPFLPDERYYIKRLVGIGGDMLSVDGATLLRNGEPITGAGAFTLNASQIQNYPGYEARWQLADGKTDTVREGFYYAMGDNSPESYDSRGWGYDFGGRYIDKRTAAEKSAGVPENQVPMNDVVGKALFIFYPLESRWGPAK